MCAKKRDEKKKRDCRQICRQLKNGGLAVQFIGRNFSSFEFARSQEPIWILRDQHQGSILPMWVYLYSSVNQLSDLILLHPVIIGLLMELHLFGYSAQRNHSRNLYLKLLAITFRLFSKQMQKCCKRVRQFTIYNSDRPGWHISNNCVLVPIAPSTSGGSSKRRKEKSDHSKGKIMTTSGISIDILVKTKRIQNT